MPTLRSWYLPVAITAGVCLPVALTALVSYGIALQLFRSRMDEYSGRVLLRAELVAKEAHSALAEANAAAGPYCGQAHRQAMARIERKYRYVREVAYQDDTDTTCTTRQGFNHQLPANAADISAERDPNFVALSDQHHLVVVDPRFYVDIVPLDSNIQLGIVDTATGETVAAWPLVKPELLKAAVTRQLDDRVVDGRIFRVARSQAMPMAVVTYESVAPLRQTWRRMLYVCIPLALGLGLLATWGLLRWLRKRHGPRFTLLEALRRREFFVNYQPIIDLNSGTCSGAEALVRWRTADGVIVSPATFIPMAESLDLLPRITDVVLEHIGHELGPLLQAQPQLHISINFAASDLRQGHLTQKLAALTERTGIRPCQVWVEITESACVNDPASREILKQLHEAGFPVYIDDFGTGYSSLAYLSDLPIDGLKIDKMFVDAIGKASATADITAHIIGMAQDLKLNIVAEGIEAADQHAYLQARSVQYGQGWLFAKALDAKSFQHFQASFAV